MIPDFRHMKKKLQYRKNQSGAYEYIIIVEIIIRSYIVAQNCFSAVIVLLFIQPISVWKQNI